MYRLLLALLLPVLFAFSSSAQFLGAELAANLVAPHELKIYLNTYYLSTADIPGTEQVSVFASQDNQLLHQVELTRQGESMDLDYPLLDSFKSGPPPGVHVIRYAANIRLTKPSYVAWKQSALPRMLNNVIQNGGEVLGLKVEIIDPAHAEFNVVPMMTRLPLLQVKTNFTGRYQLDVKEPGETDIVHVQLSEPLILAANEKGKPGDTGMPVNKNAGNSIDKFLSFDPGNREIIFDKLPFGNYLLAFTISDHRNMKTLSSHQAVFLVQSIQ